MTGDLFRPELSVDVCEPGRSARRGRARCEIGKSLRFCPAGLQSYLFTNWDETVYDALLLAAAVEFCDKSRRRSQLGWSRQLELRLPVHDPGRWSESEVVDALHDALNFLTGDVWAVSFVQRSARHAAPAPGVLQLEVEVEAVIPFSDGLDSRCVSGLATQTLRQKLVRVRLGEKAFDRPLVNGTPQPFASVPYRVKGRQGAARESSMRTRGFKFAMVSGVAAYLSGARRVLVPESGQGALGPALLPVGQAYPDYRNHPLFTQRMAGLLTAIFKREIQYEFPRLWSTKGETLEAYVASGSNIVDWRDTKSCWQQNRQASVGGKKRQCGICAACLLRRQSIHAAGQTDSNLSYIWENLAATTFEGGAGPSFSPEKITSAMREYAIAGVLHLDQLADLRHSTVGNISLKRHIFELSRSLMAPKEEVARNLNNLLERHEIEWRAFLDSLGSRSFLTQWVATR